MTIFQRFKNVISSIVNYIANKFSISSKPPESRSALDNPVDLPQQDHYDRKIPSSYEKIQLPVQADFDIDVSSSDKEPSHHR